MDAQGIAEVGATPRFVLCEPPLNAVSQAVRHYLCIVGEGVGCIAHEPATAILQSYRQIPVVERGKGNNTMGEQGIDKAVVKIQAALIDGAAALRQYRGRGEWKAIGDQVELGDKR